MPLLLAAITLHLFCVEEEPLSYLTPQEYLFHRSPMLLIEQVNEVTTESVSCSVALNSPLLNSFLEPQGLPSYIGIELMAQTVGIWSGYHDKCARRDAAKGGLILSVRAYVASAAFFPLGSTVPLDITMSMLMQERNYASFEGSITQGTTTLATGRLSLCQFDADLERKLGFN